MKEAAGEANMTVITIILIAIVLGVGTMIVSSLMKNTSDKTNNSMNGNSNCTWNENTNKYDCNK